VLHAHDGARRLRAPLLGRTGRVGLALLVLLIASTSTALVLLRGTAHAAGATPLPVSLVVPRPLGRSWRRPCA